MSVAVFKRIWKSLYHKSTPVRSNAEDLEPTDEKTEIPPAGPVGYVRFPVYSAPVRFFWVVIEGTDFQPTFHLVAQFGHFLDLPAYSRA